MTNLRKAATERWQDSLNVVLGLWLVLSPWVLGFAATLATATWNFVVVGLLTSRSPHGRCASP